MTSHDYAELLRDPRWNAKRLAVLRSREMRCEDCGAGDRELHVHHGYYKPGRMPWEYPDSALHVLCSRCHQDLHRPVGITSPVIQAIADGLQVKTRGADVRPHLWEIAQANSRPGLSKQELMSMLSWLYFRRRVRDFALLEAISRVVASARNRYALVQPGGKAIESLIGTLAGERAADEKASFMAADRAAGLARRSG